MPFQIASVYSLDKIAREVYSGKTGYESDDPRDWGRVVRLDQAGFHFLDHSEIGFCVRGVRDPVKVFECEGNAIRFFGLEDQVNVSLDVCQSPTAEQWRALTHCSYGKPVFYDIEDGDRRLDSGELGGVGPLREIFRRAKGRKI